MQGTIYIVGTTECANGAIEKVKFPVRLEKHGVNSREAKRNVERNYKNAMSSSRNFARILNNNYFPGDRFVTLTLSPRGLSDLHARAAKQKEKLERAGKECPSFEDLVYLAMWQENINLNTRTSKTCKKRGILFKYASAVSDKSEKYSEEGSSRLHIHAVVNKEAAEIYISKWAKYGEVYDEPLSAWKSGGVEDWSNLANYIVSQTRTVENGKRYTISRNLRKPSRKDRRARNPDSLLRAPNGCIVLEQGEYLRGRPQYIRFFRQRKQE